MKLAPLRGSENSPEGAGWASFAKLLVWCPGFIGKPKDQRRVALGTDGGIKSNYVESHLCRDGGASVEVPPGQLSIFADASKCDAYYMLRCCAHRETLNDDFLADSRYIEAFDYEYDMRILYRGFCSPAQAGHAAMPLTIVSAQVEDVCPFCSSPIRLKDETFGWLPGEFLKRNHYSVNFLVCSTGHVLGLARFFYNITNS
jgi:hypothetical protein